jgi:uncharacterized hydantoinase/oxoprolinase family protein
MKELFKEEDVKDLASKVYKKIVKDLEGHFYDEVQHYLYEHFDNSSNEIKRNLYMLYL